MNNRLPIYILAILVLVALVWRMANPPAPPLPGPMGIIPSWDSTTRLGDMGPSAVNPDGTTWAGAWNVAEKKGAMRSAAVIIDLEAKTSQHILLGEGYAAESLFWRDDDTFRTLLVNSADPALVTRSRLVTYRVGKKTGKPKTEDIRTDIASILAWPVGSSKFVVRLAGSPVRTAVLDENGNVVGKEAQLDVPKDAKLYKLAALSPDGNNYAFAVEKSKLGGTLTFYLADAATGVAKEIFTSRDVPGIVKGMWVSPAGLLIVADELGKFSVVRYDPASGKMVGVSGKDAVDTAKSWPDAPEEMLFATFKGGYSVDLANGKTKNIMSFDESNKQTAFWRGQIQDGQLYPRKDGGYTSVSYLAGTVDIRVIDKDGKNAQPILRRR